MRDSVDELLSQLTLQEKVVLLAGTDMWHTTPIERLGIPALKVTDGPHGARGSEGFTGAVTSACFPAEIALAASWNTALVERVGQALGQETRDKGAHVLLAPTVNIHRSPLAGRNFECFSEDPYLSARMAVAFITGVQSQGVGATVKHYVCNDSEFERYSISSEVSERALREIYLAPFKAAVQEAGTWAVMAAYNKVNGTFASENPYTLTKVLREEWGFDGVVMSDWFGTRSTSPSVNAGLDLEMPGSSIWRGENLLRAVERDEVDEATINEHVHRLLRMFVKAKAFEYPDEAPELALDRPEHRALAREAAAEGIVLLKNEQNVLPLQRGTLASLAIIGPNAKTARIMGGGSAAVVPHYAITPFDGIVASAGAGVTIGYEPGCTNDKQPPAPIPDDALERAARLAAAADVALVFAGLSSEWESEGFDRQDMELVGEQAALIEKVAEANKNTVVILNTGSPISMNWLAKVAAVVQAWYPGQECGHAIADVLFGDTIPSGKLPMTFPVRLEDNPAYINYPGENGRVCYGEGLFVGYRYYEKKKITPLFPFGFGLSYTTFSYGGLRLSAREMGPDDTLGVSVDVTNTGQYAGKEVVQLYIRDVTASLQRPGKELKAFAKVQLEPGERKAVTFTLASDALAYYDDLQHAWVAEAGEFEVLAGSSSQDVRATATFVLTTSSSFVERPS